MDFTTVTYKLLLNILNKNYYKLIPFEKFMLSCNHLLTSSFGILRHDIDRFPQNALKMAIIEHELGIKTTYYFRAIKSVYDVNIIKHISNLGHEIGYHYEEMEITDGNLEKAISIFEENLKKFRKIYPVKTICMHGSPLSKYDNRELWNVYDYKDFGIIGEPYFDIDFNKVLYLTDTGRAWNTSRGNLRDKVQSKYNYDFKSTFDIIEALEKNELPDKIMLNIHPQRWNDNWFFWAKELVWQNIKNVVKKQYSLVKKLSSS